MSEPLYIPEEHLEEVIKIIKTGLKHSDHVSRSVRVNLEHWIREEEDYLGELKQEEE